MANYSNIRNKIISDIKPNNNQEITGQIMQDTLLQMVSLLQDGGYLFKGGATTTTNPVVGDSNVFYLASVKGTYTNFGGIQVNDNELAALVYNGSWSKISIDNKIAHLKDIWNVEYLPVFFLRVEFEEDIISNISIDDVIPTDFEAIIDDLINKTAFIFAYNSINGSSELNEFLSPVSVRKIEASNFVEFIFDGINRNRYRVVVNYSDLSIQNQARQLIFLPNVSPLQNGLMSSNDKVKLNGIEAGANKYTLPVALDSTLGGIKSGGDITVASEGTVTVNKSLTADIAEEASHASNADVATLASTASIADKAKTVDAATSSKIGGVKSGEDVEVDSSGIITVHFAEKASEADCDENGDKIVDTYARFDELPVVATASKAGLVKSGGNITVASDGTVTVNKAKEAATASVATNALHATSADSSDTATTAENAVNALNDSNGVSIHTTYLKAAAVTDVTDYAEITI